MMATTDLSKEEVKRRLTLYEDNEVTEELYRFGTMLIHDAVDNLSKINGTAGATAAYCAGLITILISTATVWSNGIGLWERFLPIGAVVIAGFAAALAISSMSLRTINWFSQDDWMNADCLQDHRRLKKFHILSMWSVINSCDAAYRSKAYRVKSAQFLIALAVALLFIALLRVVWQFGLI
jgi:hypothetical protein